MKTKKQRQKQQSHNESQETTATLAPVGSEVLPPGARASRVALRQQAAWSVQLGKKLPAPLATAGWPPQLTESLEGKLTAFDQAQLDYGNAVEAAKAATQDYNAKVDDCVLYRNQLVAALRTATLGSKSPFKESQLQLTAVPKKLSAWLGDVMVQVEKHQAALKPLLGADPVAKTQAVAATLFEAMGVHGTNRTSLSEAAAKRKQARVELAAAIAQQRFAATIAFQGDKATLEEFVPVWDRNRKRPRPAKQEPGSGEPSTPAPSPAAAPAEAAAAAKPAAEAKAT